ncbi:MAG: hypothetical protein FWF09_01895, partial [Bacteroidales bacterium]|nr:hypothetical protein [Bacteroidales bacterium]
MTKKILLIIIAALLSASSLYAQSDGNSATAGKEFYITFAQNYNVVSTLQIKVVVEKACFITAKYNNQASLYWNNWNNTWVTPGIYTHNASNDDALSTTTRTTSKTITLTSTEDVCVYAINYFSMTSDATCILPVSDWGVEYRLATGVPDVSTVSTSYYSVVAHENGTLVTLHDNSTVQLGKNEVYHFFSTDIVDMTGQKVTSTKPVALFSGSALGSAPGGISACVGIGAGSGDHTYEQLWSTEKWGKDFFAFPISTPSNNFVDWGGMLALVADEDETTITLSGGINGGTDLTYTLNAGEKQYVCYVMSGLTRIVSNNPIMVFLVLPDATVTNIVPVAQRIQRATVAPFILMGYTNINKHGIDMLVPAAWWNQTVIKENGAVVPNDTYTVNSSVHFPDWHHIRKDLPNEDVTIEITCTGGFLAYMSGCGNAESYAFMAGTGAYNLQNYFTIQEKATDIDTYYENTTELTHTFEASDIIVVKRTVEKSFDAIEWLINGIPYAIVENGNSMNTLDFPASALSPGENSLTMSVRYSGATQDSLYTGKVWLQNTNTLFCGGSGTAIDPYQICTAKDLADLAEMVNAGGNVSQGKHYIVVNDLDLIDYTAGEGWIPIGSNADGYRFRGNFNGDGKVITNLVISRGEESYGEGRYQGLFGCASGATIKNVIIKNCDIRGLHKVGGLVGFAPGSAITNCHATGKVGGEEEVGGLLGYCNSSPVTDCTADCTVTGSLGTGGLVGNYLHGTITNCSASGKVNGYSIVGGLVGFLTSAQMADCFATGDVTGDENVGGLAGGSNVPVTNCYATGNVVGNNNVGGLMGNNGNNGTLTNCYATGNVNGKNGVGGLTGYNGDILTNCYATGNVTGNENVGGLAGECFASTIEKCYATGNVFATGINVGGLVGNNSAAGVIKNCFATGNVSGTNNYIGGLVGQNSSSSTITNCYATGNIGGSGNFVGGLVGGNISSSLVSNSYAMGSVAGNSNTGGLVGFNSFANITNCYAFNCKIEIVSLVNIGRIVGFTEGTNTLTNNHAYNQMKLWTNGDLITPTPNPNGKDGADVSYVNALYQSTYPTSWFSGTPPAWTFDYTNHHIAPKTNLPILTAFTKTAFPNVIQQAHARLCGCGGDGTETDPIQICIEQDLKDLSDIVNLDLGYSASEGVYYIVVNDLDFAGFDYGDAGGWIPIGNNQSVNRIFRGNFNGNGKAIRNITINRPTEDYQGVFGRVNDATFKNLGIENCNIAGGSRVGALVGGGSTTAGGIIENCYATGNISGNATGFLSHGYIGGLAGTYTIIKNSYATCNVTGTGANVAWVGGLVGSVSNIENCYTTGNVIGAGNLVGGLAGRSLSIANSYATGNVTGIDRIGGLSGMNGSSDNSGFLTNSYATGNVTGNNQVGGLAGENTSLVENSYANGNVTGTDYVGGLVGSHGWSTISNCYALNTKVEALGTNVGRVAYSHISAAYSNNYAYDEMELLVNGVPITPTPNLNDKDGANVSCEQVITASKFPTPAWLSGTSPAWKMQPYGTLNTKPGTNLPILSAFTPSAFPNAVQEPRMEECNVETLFCGGSGTEIDPYQICTAKDLADLAEMVNAIENVSQGIYYIVVNDLDLIDYTAGEGWIPIGTMSGGNYEFKGNFNGNGKVITNLVINRPAAYSQGLFGDIHQGATIKNLGIENCNVSGNENVGSLVGFSAFAITIENCYATGNVSGNGSVGGLAGFIVTTHIQNCHTAVNVSGGVFLGGLAGACFSSTIENCYTTGTVTGNNIGGLVGDCYSSTISNCYATGNVSGSNSIGGLVGGNSQNGIISNCYAFNCKVETTIGTNVGRIAGNSAGTLTNNYGYEQMELWANGVQIAPTPAPNGKDGTDVSIEQATTESQFPTPAWLSGTSPVWKMQPYGTLNTKPQTNLPILSAFTPSAFPNAIQEPRIEECNVKLDECLELSMTGISSEGCVELEWEWIPPPPTGTYGFTLYQWDETLGDWQTASTNYDKTIYVLNVYPDLLASNTLKTWMDDPAIGLGKIIVTPVTITEFNANPDLYLKNGSGEYIYDAIMFGSWDYYGDAPGKDLNSTSALAIRTFLDSGRGVIFGHDTQYYLKPFFSTLCDKTNLITNNYSNYGIKGGTDIKVVNDGFLLKYPHIIPYESILTIPCTHTTHQFACGIVWMNFPYTSPAPCYYGAPELTTPEGTNNFYLTTWNNTAVIQTGHTGGGSTIDERKVIANVLWYVSQFTTDMTAKICSALDFAAPDAPTANRYDCTQIEIFSQDNGSPYSFYVKATNTTNYADTCKSNILDVVNKSGLKGFYILEDDNPVGTPDPLNPSTVFMAATDNEIIIYPVQDPTKYVHIQAVDWVGNLSEVVTLGTGEYAITISATPPEGGSIFPEGDVDVECGDELMITFEAADCYQIAQVLIDGVNDPDAVDAEKYFFDYITGSHTVEVIFEKIPYTITATTSAGGNISPSGAVVAKCGEDQTFTFKDTECHQIVQVLVDGIEDPDALETGEYTFTDIRDDHTIHVIFVTTYHEIILHAYPPAGGTVEGAEDDIPCGELRTITATPDDCYTFKHWEDPSGNIISTKAIFTFPVMSDTILTAIFEIKTFNVILVPLPDGGGTVEGANVYECGDEVVIKAIPNHCYKFVKWTENGVLFSENAEETIT